MKTTKALTFFAHTQARGTMLNFLQIKKSHSVLFVRNSSPVFLFTPIFHNDRHSNHAVCWKMIPGTRCHKQLRFQTGTRDEKRLQELVGLPNLV